MLTLRHHLGELGDLEKRKSVQLARRLVVSIVIWWSRSDLTESVTDMEDLLFQTANQLNGEANLTAYGAKTLFVCARTSSAVIEWTSTLPPASARSFASSCTLSALSLV